MSGARVDPCLALLAGLALAAALGAAEPPARTYDFDADVSGSPPTVQGH